MGIRKPAKIISVVLAMILLLPSMSPAFREKVNALDVEGYETVDYSDFGDEGEAVPPYWGFTPASSTVAIHTEDLGGNTTPKLQYNIVNQSGGRIASKTFASPVGGAKVLFEFDWYPGKVNDKGNHQFENGGEVKFFDSAGNAIFTINHTINASLSYYVGRRERAATGFTNPEAWYHAKVAFDLIDNEAALRRYIH